MTTRRDFLASAGAALCVVAAPHPSLAQQPARVARIGFLGLASASSSASRVEALRGGLRDLGYFEGRNISIEFRWAEGKYDRLPQLARELVQLKVDVIVTHGTPGVRAVRDATATIPVVIAAAGDAIANRLVSSLRRPGGNVTGSTFFSAEVAAKQIELFKEGLPRVTRIALLVNPRSSAQTNRPPAAVADRLKVGFEQFDASSPAEFEAAFAAMAKKHLEAVWVQQEPAFTTDAQTIAGLALRHRLPSIGFNEFAHAGGLIGYGENILEMFRRAAYFVDRIVKGARPGDLPVERATKFDLVVNLKTAKALGLTISPNLLFRADRVIE